MRGDHAPLAAWMALAGLQRQAAQTPDRAAVWWRLGRAYRRLGSLEEAQMALLRAVALNPDQARLRLELGMVLARRHLPEAAIAHYRRAIALAPTAALLHTNLGLAYEAMEHYETALACFDRAAACAADPSDAHAHRGQALVATGALDQALTVFDTVLAAQPDHVEARLGRARALLLSGDLVRGWPAYDVRWHRIGVDPDALFGSRRWTGQDLRGRTILLRPEQGAGDTIQFLRLAPMLRERGGRVVLAVPGPLLRLAATAPGIDRVVDAAQPAPAHDYVATLLDVPAPLGLGFEHLSGAPYLRVPPQAARPGLSRPPGTRLAVGLAWAGNPAHRRDRFRSLDPAELSGLFGVPGVAFYSLQTGPAAARIGALGLGAIVQPCVPERGDFADTAAVIDHLDLVISVDTAIAHLAGAMGKPVWTLLPYAPDWRWMLERTDTPWYGSMRLWRMARLGRRDFDPLRAALEAL